MTHKIAKSQTTGSNLIALICAPEHDRLTRFTFGLFNSFPNLHVQTIFVKITHPITYDQVLATLALDPDTEIALIFAGHGEPFALLCPGVAPASPDYETAVSNFYDDTLLYLGPSRMLAFCCSAADGLGYAFSATPGRVFVGFRKPIWFVMKGGVYGDWWSKILHEASLAMLEAGDAQQIRDKIEELYLSAYRYFNSPKGRKAEWALLMRMYLRGQMQELDIIAT